MGIVPVSEVGVVRNHSTVVDCDVPAADGSDERGVGIMASFVQWISVLLHESCGTKILGRTLATAQLTCLAIYDHAGSFWVMLTAGAMNCGTLDQFT